MRTAGLAGLLFGALLVSMAGCTSILGIEEFASGDAIDGGADAASDGDASVSDAAPSPD